MKKSAILLLILSLLLGCCACGSAPDSAAEPAAPEAAAAEVTDAPAAEPTAEPTPEPVSYPPLPNGMSGNPAAYDASVPATNILRDEVQDKFSQELFEDPSTGLSLDFNLFLPENYGNGDKYPLVFFMSDSSLVGKAVNAPVIQCRGAMIWASEAWQAEYPCIVAVPQFNTTIIDDNSGSEEITDYVEAAANLIRMLCESYDVDTDRLYGMGQSMGCMVSLYLDAKYDDLYAACLFVDGQWNIGELEGLKDRKFVYFAAEGDQKASAGMAEVKQMLADAGIPYGEAVWNAQDDQASLNEQALTLLAEGNDINFISWQIGSVVGKPGQDGGMREHMASFDYAFRQSVLRAWLFAQSK